MAEKRKTLLKKHPLEIILLVKCKGQCLWWLFFKFRDSVSPESVKFKEALSVLMLRGPMFIFISGSSALLGHPRCGLSIWLLLLAIFNTLFWVYANVFHEKMDKTWKYLKSAIFVWYENGHRQSLGAQSINAERASLMSSNTNTPSLLKTKLNSDECTCIVCSDDFCHLFEYCKIPLISLSVIGPSAW